MRSERGETDAAAGGAIPPPAAEATRTALTEAWEAGWPLRHSWGHFQAGCFGVDPVAPPRGWEVDVAAFLWGRGYSPAEASFAIDHARRLGSVDCCPTLAFDPFDRAEVERLVPAADDDAWLAYDVEAGVVQTWELGDAPP